MTREEAVEYWERLLKTFSNQLEKEENHFGRMHLQTTIDAVPVVRCRECKYWQDNNSGYPHDECRWGNGETPDPDDFCSYGERKEGAD